MACVRHKSVCLMALTAAAGLNLGPELRISALVRGTIGKLRA